MRTMHVAHPTARHFFSSPRELKVSWNLCVGGVPGRCFVFVDEPKSGESKVRLLEV